MKNSTAQAINFQDPFNSELWDHYVKTSDFAQSAACGEDDGDQLLEDSQESQDESLRQMSCQSIVPSERSSSSSSSSLLDTIVERTKAIALDKLTNVEFWIHHLDSIFTEDCILEAAQDGWTNPGLSQNLIEEFLRIMNAHLSKTYPYTFLDMDKKNFFPKLADILSKRLPILFGDYLNKVDIENVDPCLSPALHIEEEEKADSDGKGRKSGSCIEEFIEKLKYANHGRHRVTVSRDKTGQPVISCDGFHFRSKSNLKQDLTGGNNYFKCTFRSCKAFIKIRHGVFSRYPSRAAHLNHPIPKTLKLLKESGD